ncbi:BTB/POZ and TAZ domain-containing protein 3 [Aegilops tauschii subsp. strangulata]|uniref:BTB domain-containing protein n=2 Tax=Aegilops tauschii subsp. strangulata TaxID=200361 RepID=A0A453G5W2_AEGTS|nr:BTB/POZ and TAZ domain-containing protein 3 [Aegilops tauschii subsp. strangulata]XP_044358881.1 BTB/POZ and TAZ domain-containing protein 3-like [Triticum aestivum]
MAPLESGSSQLFFDSSAIDGPFDVYECGTLAGTRVVPDPPPPGTSYGKQRSSRNAKKARRVHGSEEVEDCWNRLFLEGYQADVRVSTGDGSQILSHSCILGIRSPVLRSMLEEARIEHGFRNILISGVPSEAVRVFIRFLYSSRFEQGEMKKYALHLLVLSHVFSVQSLKIVCTDQLERFFLAPDNVVDVLQLARLCDAPRLSLICTRMIVGDFKTISLSEGWKVMRRANPSLEQELLEFLVEVDTRRQERAKRMEEKKVYLQLYEAMEALVHICRDGCRTIGPWDQKLKGSQVVCKFPACKGIELLVRHFSACKKRVPRGCANCKRMWQLLELHSRMCSTPDTCRVPLCRHFKDKIWHRSKKEEIKWNILVCKVLESNATSTSILKMRKTSSLMPNETWHIVQQ